MFKLFYRDNLKNQKVIKNLKKKNIMEFENTGNTLTLLTENNESEKVSSQKKEKMSFTFKDLEWNYILLFIVIHIGALYGFFTFPYSEKKATFLWVILVYSFTVIGIVGGAHRLWSHRSYKAKLPLRLILAMFFYASAQFKMLTWTRIHRTHHKYVETDADPTNAKRGFFFAHMGWIMLKRHPECLKRLREIDVSDVKADPIIRFGDRHFGKMVLIFHVIIPIIIPVYFWNETLYWAIISQFFMRNFLVGHVAGSGNSVAHMWGSKPYDRNIDPANNKYLNVFTLGDGWHNYHHTFPWDYKAAELGLYKLNVITLIIELFAKIGLVYDLKQPSQDLIKMTCERKGDGSHPFWKNEVPAPK